MTKLFEAQGILGKLQRSATRAAALNIGHRFNQECALLAKDLLQLLEMCGWTEYTDTPCERDKEVLKLIDRTVRAVLKEQFPEDRKNYRICSEQDAMERIHDVLATLYAVGAEVSSEVLEYKALPICQVIAIVLEPFKNYYPAMSNQKEKGRSALTLEVIQGGRT
jgi:hypothetical protein